MNVVLFDRFMDETNLLHNWKADIWKTLLDADQKRDLKNFLFQITPWMERQHLDDGQTHTSQRTWQKVAFLKIKL